tara:strand:+ start:93 stop:356 length:264 start_codon:yes stop_codon:yes gene_type:complete
MKIIPSDKITQEDLLCITNIGTIEAIEMKSNFLLFDSEKYCKNKKITNSTEKIIAEERFEGLHNICPTSYESANLSNASKDINPKKV